MYILILIHVIAIGVCQPLNWELLVSELNQDNQATQGWQGATNIDIGIPNVLVGDSYLEKNFQLNIKRAVKQVRIVMNIYPIGKWQDEQIKFIVNGVLRLEIQGSRYNNIDNILLQSTQQIQLEFDHFMDNINIQIQSDDGTQFGINEFYIFATLCQNNCLKCDSETCQVCREGFTGNNCLCAGEIIDNICHLNCPSGYFFEDLKCQPYQITKLYDVSRDDLLTNTLQIEADNHLIGPLNKNDWVQMNIEGHTSDTYVYLSMEVVILNMQHTNSVLSVNVNEVQWCSIMFFNEPTVVTSKLISQQTCDISDDCLVIRIETQLIKQILPTYTYSFKIVDYNGYKVMKTESIQWFINSIEVLKATKLQTLCKPGCAICDSYTTCTQCNNNLFLYQNTCLVKCPSHSVQVSNNQCNDLLSSARFSSYLVKVLFSTEQLDQSTDYLGSQIGGTDTYNDIRIVNGLNTRIMSRGQYLKSFSTQPHYEIQYSIEVSFQLQHGPDDYTFSYQIGQESQQILQANLNSTNQNYITMRSEQTIRHNERYLYVSTNCMAKNSCLITNYFIIVRECHPYCMKCTGPTLEQCNNYKMNIQQFNPTTIACISGYYMDSQQLCQHCDFNCSECTIDGCTICYSGYRLVDGLGVKQCV